MKATTEMERSTLSAKLERDDLKVRYGLLVIVLTLSLGELPGMFDVCADGPGPSVCGVAVVGSQRHARRGIGRRDARYPVATGRRAG